MKESRIRVFVKNPDTAMEAVEIPNTLEALQELVGGYIETLALSNKLVAIFNEEGRILQLPLNMRVGSSYIYGPIVFAGYHGEEFASAPYRKPANLENVLKSLRHD